MEIRIKIDGLDEFTQTIALLASALAYRNGMENTAKSAEEIMDRLMEDKDKEETIIEDAPALQNKYTREEVRAAFVAKNSPSNRNQLKAILDKYGASNISELKEEYFEAVMKDLEEL